MEENTKGYLDIDSYFYLRESHAKFDALEDYLSIMDKQVTTIVHEQSEQRKKDIEDVSDTLNGEDQILYIEHRNAEYEQFERYFAENFRYSFIVLVWLVIEDELKRVCLEIRRRKGLELRKLDRNRVFEQCKKILKEDVGIAIANITYWSNICDLRKIRNCIVHTAGFIDRLGDKDKEQLKQLVEKYLDLHLDDFDQHLRITTEYCTLAIQNTKGFFFELFDNVDIKYWKVKS